MTSLAWFGLPLPGAARRVQRLRAGGEERGGPGFGLQLPGGVLSPRHSPRGRGVRPAPLSAPPSGQQPPCPRVSPSPGRLVPNRKGCPLQGRRCLFWFVLPQTWLFAPQSRSRPELSVSRSNAASDSASAGGPFHRAKVKPLRETLKMEIAAAFLQCVIPKLQGLRCSWKYS